MNAPEPQARAAWRLGLEHSYARDLPGAYVRWRPATVPAPQLVFFNAALAEELGLDAELLRGPAGAAFFAGNALPADADPIAQVYAGHQFGGFSPRLGDGRALLLGERIDRAGRRHDIAFKGSGRTPYSRGGDGKAALGPMLREALIGEALHGLGIPTTRALAVAATGEPVYRETVLPGAVLTRVAASHLRVGSFQYFAAQGELEALRRLLDHSLARHDPALAERAPAERPLALLRAVAERQAALLAQWMNIGFIHGVMNTDNMAISGQSIDFGPCAFLEAYDPEAVFSSIDHGGRYAYGNQPLIARWNLARLAEALLPLLADADDEAAVARAVAAATEVIDAFPARFDAALREGQRRKLGLRAGGPAEDAALADDWLQLLHTQAVDFTQAWRALGPAAQGDQASLAALFSDAPALQAWLARWQARCRADDATHGGDGAARAQRMAATNPRIVARNQRVEEALAAASSAQDFGPFERLLDALRRPFDEDPALQRYAEPAPREITARYQTFCGT